MKKGRPRAALGAALVRYFGCVEDEFGEVAPFVPVDWVLLLDGAALVPALLELVDEGAALVPLETLPELDGALVPLDMLPELDGALVPLDMLPELDGALVPLEALPELAGAFVPLESEPEELPSEDDDVPPDCWPHCCWAAWVRGPMMPSTGPGSQPCDLSCCCSWRTDSSPFCELAWPLAPASLEAALPVLLIDDEPCADADEPLVPLPDAEGALVPLVDAEGALVPLADGLDCAVSCDWEEVDCEACLSDVLPAAIAPVAAITAATRASLFSSMCQFLLLGWQAGKAEGTDHSKEK